MRVVEPGRPRIVEVGQFALFECRFGGAALEGEGPPLRLGRDRRRVSDQLSAPCSPRCWRCSRFCFDYSPKEELETPQGEHIRQTSPEWA